MPQEHVRNIAHRDTKHGRHFPPPARRTSLICYAAFSQEIVMECNSIIDAGNEVMSAYAVRGE